MIARTLYEQDHEMFRDSVRKWVAAEITPHVDTFRETGKVSKELWKSAGAQGFLCMYADEKYGGAGIDDFRYDMILIEEMAMAGAGSGFAASLHNRVVGPYLHKFGTDDQRDRFMPGCVSGETPLAIALTEPGTGSDLAGMKTKAEDKGDHWVINGQKTYISNGQIAELIVVAAKTDPDKTHAVGLFLVPADTPGFQRGKKLRKMGQPGQDTSELFFDNVKVPKENVLGDPTGGFKVMMNNLAEERIISAVGSLSAAERSFQITLQYIKERTAFGKPIGLFQNSRFKMAHLRTRLDATWALLDHCATQHVAGKLTSELAAEIKLFASETQGEVVDECVQLHGGAGYMDEYEIAKQYVDARVSRIYAGSSEIMKEIIGRGLGLDDRKRNH
ncbi:acyl-CoA dehydrogenase family protein [Albimonas sp. CAU 1670]|uniref:acyl-CoA dehydrogenase family protein n=1 Tax=Albimonas sp. CAU 1670 TaxID=3032599 RepID=UPI0023DA0B62|nr:acyl-CoA dehydrogenase family protein [Albimonas sp. CAU 1670]MDF2232276.1 acyl-CoA dehydrogenase family protein [Albimonas sp. CAU 1670]